MPKQFIYCLLALLLVSPFTAAATNPELTGAISYIDTHALNMGSVTYRLVKGDSLNLKGNYENATQCFVGKNRITCGTLAAVGYVENARITVNNGNVVKIEVIEMRQ